MFSPIMTTIFEEEETELVLIINDFQNFKMMQESKIVVVYKRNDCQNIFGPVDSQCSKIYTEDLDCLLNVYRPFNPIAKSIVRQENIMASNIKKVIDSHDGSLDGRKRRR